MGRSTSFYRSLVDLLPQSVFRKDSNGCFTYVNRTFSDQLRQAPEAILGKTDYDFFPRSLAEKYRADDKSVMQKQRSLQTVETHSSPSGEEQYVQVTKVPIFNSRNEVEGIQGIFWDVTDRVLAQKALARQEQFYRNVIDTDPNPIFVKDKEGRFILVNEANAAFNGLSPNEMIGKTDAEVNPNPDEVRKFLADDHEVMTTGKEKVVPEERTSNQSGEVRWFQTVKRPLISSDGELEGILGISVDITQRKRVEEELSLSEERYRFLFERNPNPLFLYDEASLQFLWVNEAAIQHYGYTREEFLRMTIKDIRPEEDVPKLIDTLENRDASDSISGTWRHLKKNGSLIYVEVYSNRIDFQGKWVRLTSVSDVTEKQALEEQLRQSQKMESVGQLAGGVAHDFNNLLTIIQGHVTLLRNKVGANEGAQKSVRAISEASERASSLTRQLLTFSRRKQIQPAVIDLHEVINGMSEMLRHVLDEDVGLKLDCGTNVPLIYADPGMIEQVILNLAVNAGDAMPNGGELGIETKSVSLSEDDAQQMPELSPGWHACLQVSDTGKGIPPNDLPHLFEPFFTTKEVGKGTGLGLATVYGIVRQHNGRIQVESDPGRLTRFTIYFAAAPRQELNRGVESSQATRDKGEGTVLVVEDEDSLRELVSEVLTEQGYRVFCAHSGESAMEVWKKATPPIDLVVTDLVMPGKVKGEQLANELLHEKPDLKVVYTTGYSREVFEGKNLTLKEGVNFLQKPYPPDELTQVIQNRLGSAGAGE